MGKVLMKIATVVEVEDDESTGAAGGLRIRAKLSEDRFDETKPIENIPWAFPLLPKTLQSVPKEGEAVLLIADAIDEFKQGQMYYIGPIISQPQYHENCITDNATTLIKQSHLKPLERMSKEPATNGSFPEAKDVALVGRGKEDVILRYNSESEASEVDIRAGIRNKYASKDNPNLVGNIIFNNADPAYIQLKYKNGLATGQKHPCSSTVNIVADYINIMSNYDYNVSDNIHSRDTLIDEKKFDETMNKLHQVPKGDKLVELLKIMKDAILFHVHGWPGKPQCGDWGGNVEKLRGFTIEDILSDFVRIS